MLFRSATRNGLACLLLESAILTHRLCYRPAFGKSSLFGLPVPVEEGRKPRNPSVERLVELLSWLQTQPSVAKSTREHPVDPDIAAHLEQWVNALIYELYFPTEIHAASLQFFDLTESLKLPALDSLPTEPAARLERFRKLHKEWSSQGHRLRIALDKLRTLDLVRTIEGDV